MNHDSYTNHLQWHRAIPAFDYDDVIDWAMGQMEKGVESENIMILASFSKPVSSYDIQPYVYEALQELGLEEKYADYSVKANVQYHLEQILHDYNIRKNLSAVYNLFSFDQDEYNLYPFYLLYHAWNQLDEIHENYYVEHATLDNIESILKYESQIWLDAHIHGSKNYQSSILGSHTQQIKNPNYNTNLKGSTHSLWHRILDYIKKV